jgi:hypothetical protein
MIASSHPSVADHRSSGYLVRCLKRTRREAAPAFQLAEAGRVTKRMPVRTE